MQEEIKQFVAFTEMKLEDLVAMTEDEIQNMANVCRVSKQDIFDRMSELAGVNETKESPVEVLEVVAPEVAPVGVAPAPVPVGVAPVGVVTDVPVETIDTEAKV